MFALFLDAKPSPAATGPATLDHQNLQDRELSKGELAVTRAFAALKQLVNNPGWYCTNFPERGRGF